MATSPFNADVPPKHYLREWREFKGYSQEELGRKCGVTGGVLSRYEKGDRGLPIDFMFKLFEALDILPGQFFGPPQMPDLNLQAMDLGAKERRSLKEIVEIASKLTEKDRQEILQAMRAKLSTPESQSTHPETA